MQADISIFETTEDPAGVHVDRARICSSCRWAIVSRSLNTTAAAERTYIGTLQEWKRSKDDGYVPPARWSNISDVSGSGL